MLVGVMASCIRHTIAAILAVAAANASTDIFRTSVHRQNDSLKLTCWSKEAGSDPPCRFVSPGNDGKVYLIDKDRVAFDESETEAVGIRDHRDGTFPECSLTLSLKGEHFGKWLCQWGVRYTHFIWRAKKRIVFLAAAPAGSSRTHS